MPGYLGNITALETTQRAFLQSAEQERAEIEGCKKSLEEQRAQLSTEREQWNTALQGAEDRQKGIEDKITAFIAAADEQLRLRRGQLAQLEAEITRKAASVGALPKGDIPS